MRTRTKQNSINRSALIFFLYMILDPEYILSLIQQIFIITGKAKTSGE